MTPTMTAPATEEAIDVAGCAAMLHVSTDTVYHRARSGDLPAFKVGRVWRFWPSEVRKAVATKPLDPWAQSPASRRARRAH